MLWIFADATASRAQDASMFDAGRLLATAGVAQVEGAAGGGLVPWATVTGYGTRDAIGANFHYTLVNLSNFRLQSAGVAVGLFDRMELSLARQFFDTEATGGALGLGRGFTLQQTIGSVKVRLFGNAVYDQDSLLPQIAVGSMVKFTDHGDVLRAVGARASAGADFYVAATKILLDRSLLLDATLRMTRANQFGLLGFGGPHDNDYHPEFEGSAALLLSRQWAAGVEYRTKPDALSFAREGDAYDAFLAYFLNKHLSATLAYVDLGSIATRKNQQGVYLSLVGGF